MWHVLGWSIKNCGSFLKYIVLVSKTMATSYIFNKQKCSTTHYSACRWQNCQLVLVEKLVKLFYSNCWQNPQITAAAYYFQKQPPEVFCKKKGVPKKFTNFIRKHLCWSLFLIKLQAIKKKLQHRCFTMKFAKFLRTPMLKNICKIFSLKFSP